jgi:hypothetical protein
MSSALPASAYKHISKSETLCNYGEFCRSTQCQYWHKDDVRSKSAVPMVKDPNKAGKTPHRPPSGKTLHRPPSGTVTNASNSFRDFLLRVTKYYNERITSGESRQKYNQLMISNFKNKGMVDNFLTESYKRFTKVENKTTLDDEWLCNIYIIKRDANDIKNKDGRIIGYHYNEYESYYFLLIANIFLHLEEYCAKYGKDYGIDYARSFLIQVLTSFEEQSVTGTYTVPTSSEVGLKLKAFKETYPELYFDPTKFDNTTIKVFLTKMKPIGDESVVVGSKSHGGKSNKTHKRVKRKTNKTNKTNKTHKRVKSVKRIKRKSNKTHKRK